MNSLVVILGIVALLFLLIGRLRQGMRVKPHLINSPRLGILNLKGPSILQTVDADRSALSTPFSTVFESTTVPPKCDVLFVYCDFAADGHVLGATGGLRDIIRDSGAYVVVVASENSGESCTAAAKRTGYGQANLVLTLDRRGSAFPTFFHSLFESMANGESMPIAWVRLAPQVPGRDRPNCPDAFFICEAGQIAFAPTLSYET